MEIKCSTRPASIKVITSLHGGFIAPLQPLSLEAVALLKNEEGVACCSASVAGQVSLCLLPSASLPSLGLLPASRTIAKIHFTL